MVTLMSNRLGDLFLLFSIVGVIFYGWVGDSVCFRGLLSLFIIGAGLTKRAQFPLRV